MIKPRILWRAKYGWCVALSWVSGNAAESVALELCGELNRINRTSEMLRERRRQSLLLPENLK